MTLKTATVVVIAGLSLDSLVTIGMHLRNWASAPAPPPVEAWAWLLSAVALKLSLLLFFVTLYLKQRSAHP